MLAGDAYPSGSKRGEARCQCLSLGWSAVGVKGRPGEWRRHPELERRRTFQRGLAAPRIRCHPSVQQIRCHLSVQATRVYERRSWGGKTRSAVVAGGRTGGGRPLPGEHAFLNAVDANDLVNLCRCVDVSFYEARVSAVSSPEVRFQMSTTFVQKMVLGAAAAAAVMTLASGCGSTGKGPGGGSAPTPTSGTSPTSSAPGGGGAAF